jgi:hypothetical protein
MRLQESVEDRAAVFYAPHIRALLRYIHSVVINDFNCITEASEGAEQVLSICM